MGLVLAIDTSSVDYAVAVGAGDSPAALRTARRGDAGFAGVGGLASSALADIGARFSDIETIAVDVGPGGLSSIRSAVAYANGLAFSLGIKIFPVTSLELMAIAAQRAPEAGGPLLSLKRAQGGNVYAGLYAGGEMIRMRHGRPGDIIPEMTGHLTAFRLAGMAASEVTGLVPGATVVHAGIAEADVAVLYAAARTAARDLDRLVGTATALNEGSPVFHADKPAA